MIVVSDSSPLIGLAKAGRLKLLHRMFGQVLIPKRVYQDVVTNGRGRPGARAVANAVRERWIRVASVRDQGLVPWRLLETGEGDAIALCIERKADFLIADDRVARNECARLNIACLTTVGVIRAAKLRGLVKEAAPIFRRMIERGFGIADYEAILTALGE